LYTFECNLYRYNAGTEVEIITETIAVEDAREPYVVKVKMVLREAGGASGGAGQEGAGGGGTVFALGEAVYQKVGAVRSMW
jgi:hypothetical protein